MGSTKPDKLMETRRGISKGEIDWTEYGKICSSKLMLFDASETNSSMAGRQDVFWPCHICLDSANAADIAKKSFDLLCVEKSM